MPHGPDSRYLIPYYKRMCSVCLQITHNCCLHGYCLVLTEISQTLAPRMHMFFYTFSVVIQKEKKTKKKHNKRLCSTICKPNTNHLILSVFVVLDRKSDPGVLLTNLQKKCKSKLVFLQHFRTASKTNRTTVMWNCFISQSAYETYETRKRSFEGTHPKLSLFMQA